MLLTPSLADALRHLQRSGLARQCFGETFIDGYVASKRMELASFLEEISPWERRCLAAQV